MFSDLKRVLITGGVRRLGLHIAYAFSARGARLGLNYFHSSTAEAESAKAECLRLGASEVLLIPADVTINAEAIVAQFTSSFGGIDILVNNAGVMPPRRDLETIQIADFERTLGLNLVAPLAMAKAAAPLMSSGSAIINIASLGGIQIWQHRIDYNVSKSALITLTEALAKELATKGITVNAVAPGAILVDDEGAERMGIAENRIPMGHYGNPEDIAKAVLYFAYEAPYVTGQTLVVDGGRSVS